MENSENKKTKNSKKILIAFIIVLVVILAIAIPVSILMQDKSQKKNNKELKGPKDIKQYECTKKGEVCTFEQMYEGVEVNVEVAEGKTYTFSMIANGRDTMTLMLQQNIKDDVEWHAEGINMKGPQTSRYMINEITKDWTKIDHIDNYEYMDKGKITSDAYCNTTESRTDYECPKNQYDKRGYNGINITDGKIKLLYNLPPDEIEMPNSPVLTETTLKTTGKVRFITLEEYEEFVTEDGPAKWLIENLDKNEGYWTMTSAHKLTTGYNHAAISIINRDGKPDTEDVPVARGNKYFKVGIRPVITVYKK